MSYSCLWLTLPVHLTAHIISTCLEINDLAKLDSAHCLKQFRPAFLRAAYLGDLPGTDNNRSSPIRIGKVGKSEEYVPLLPQIFRWIVMKGLHVNGICLPINFMVRNDQNEEAIILRTQVLAMCGPHLRWIKMYVPAMPNSREISTVEIEDVLDFCPRITSLHLLTDKGSTLESLHVPTLHAQCPQLHCLRLSGFTVSTPGFAELNTHLVNLEELDLDECHPATFAIDISLSRQTALRTLKLPPMCRVDLTHASAIAQSRATLTTLSLRGPIADDALPLLLRQCTALRNLWIDELAEAAPFPARPSPEEKAQHQQYLQRLQCQRREHEFQQYQLLQQRERQEGGGQKREWPPPCLFAPLGTVNLQHLHVRLQGNLQDNLQVIDLQGSLQGKRSVNEFLATALGSQQEQDTPLRPGTLQTLHVSGASQGGLLAIATLCGTCLHSLTLHACSNLTPGNMRLLANGLPRLINFAALQCADLSDDAVRALVTTANVATALRGVRLVECPLLTADTVVALGHHCHYLQRVGLVRLPALQDAALNVLFHNNPLLVEVCLIGCEKVTDAPLWELTEYCLALQRLQVTDCASVDRDILDAIQSHYHHNTPSAQVWW